MPKRTRGREVSNSLKLAILGHPPALNEKCYVGVPNLGEISKLERRINDIFNSKLLTNNGIYVQEFEKQIAELTGVSHCIAVNNGTSGLQIAARALELTGEVLLPSFTFVATAHALQWQGIEPVFCDIDPDTHNIDPRSVEERITTKTTGIIGVHVWGRPCDIDTLQDISRRHQLKLVFDAAHAFGASHKGEMIGNFGNAEVFSFHATKYINTLEGGAILTNDDEFARRARMMRNFGFTQGEIAADVGINGKMNEISAAIGITGLESREHWIASNYEMYKVYQSELDSIPGIYFLSYDESEACNYQYVVLEVEEETLHLSRDQFLAILQAENIMARRYFYPGCHKMEPYRSKWVTRELPLPQTERIADRVIALPTGLSLGTENAKRICLVIQYIVDHSLAIEDFLKRRETRS
jgi:dTDP-4-amino-4,6-dideoxygalactose transaminase